MLLKLCKYMAKSVVDLSIGMFVDMTIVGEDIHLLCMHRSGMHSCVAPIAVDLVSTDVNPLWAVSTPSSTLVPQDSVWARDGVQPIPF
jgi:hypothetical protein